MKRHSRRLALVTMMAMVSFGAALAGDASANLERGKQLYHARCDYCHLERGSGTFMLARHLGKEKALLENRTDLPPEYIRSVCRSGIGGMPPYTRTELPDNELDLITAYLNRPAAARSGDSVTPAAAASKPTQVKGAHHE